MSTFDLKEKLQKFFAVRGNSNPSVQEQQIVTNSWGMGREFKAMSEKDRRDRQTAVTLTEILRYTKSFFHFLLLKARSAS